MRTRYFFSKFLFIPPLIALITNIGASFFTRFIGGRTVDIATVVDDKIPFVPEFIYIYILAYIQWVVCIIAVMISDEYVGRRYCFAISVANIISGIFFLVMPTVAYIRPEEFTGGGTVTEFLGNFIYAADNPPQNAFPSIHCLHSWGCMRMLFALKSAPRSIKIINATVSFLVFASVVFVKQHFFIDIPAGILVFELGLFITKYTQLDQGAVRVETKLFLHS